MEFDVFFEHEGRAKRLYPVIHVNDLEQTRRNAVTAFEHGADGVFLINHGITTALLLTIAAILRSEWPKRFIGVNLLTEPAKRGWEMASRPGQTFSALWVDDSGVDDHIRSYADHLYERMKHSSWSGYYFASVAFKGQAPVSDAGITASHAGKMAHVIVTSGDRTGLPPSVEKIRTMKAAIPNHPLAIASGMTRENIHQFLPYADIFMVATGISDRNDNLDPRLVSHMATIIQNYNKSSGLLQ